MPLSPDEQRKIIETVMQAKHGGSMRGGLRSQLSRKFGPFGELIGMVADVLSGGSRPRQKEIEDAIRVLTEHGFRVGSGGGPGPEETPPDRLPKLTRPRGTQRSQPPTFTTSRPAAEPWPQESIIKTLPTRIRGQFDLVPEDVEGLSPEVLTPESSNVYSIQYDYDTGLLYVRFNAAAPNMGYKNMTSVCTGREYKVGIRPHSPGPLYSYGGAGRKIPLEKWQEFVGAASKGQWVWSNLRVCGSQWQHQVPYTLTSIPDEVEHVPRKATRRGLQVRTVPTVGTGRRGGRRSSLPPRIR